MSLEHRNAAYVSIVAPTVPYEHLRAAENVGIALANKLKAAGADVIVTTAKKTIEKEILMKQQEKDLAIKKATCCDVSVDNNKLCASRDVNNASKAA